jgi:putative two-component system response regulator
MLGDVEPSRFGRLVYTDWRYPVDYPEHAQGKGKCIGGKVLEEAEAFDPERSFLTIGKLVAYHHHEKWGGSGYPDGLAGEAIPLLARIVAVADVYDALRSHRPCKDALSHQDALAIISEGNGTHFDPALVTVFLDIEGDIASIIRNS